MILDVSVYLIVFIITTILVSIYQRYWHGINIRCGPVVLAANSGIMHCAMWIVSMFPIIAMYGLRYGIGTDYFSYEQIYDVLHDASVGDYWSYHGDNVGAYYVEFLYYLLNVVMPSYTVLQWGISVFIFVTLYFAVRQYSREISYPFAIFIYLTTQFIYSMNGVRFSIALCFLLLAYVALAKDNNRCFFIMIIFASLFHTSALFCLPLYFLKEFKNVATNRFRDLGILLFVLFFPALVQYLFEFAADLSVFARYFATALYSASAEMEGGFKWIIHIVPVLLPLIIFCRKEIFSEVDSGIYFRICLMEIPFRMLGQYNTWFTRYTRCSQIILVIFIPLILSRVKDRKKRFLLEAYYVFWYAFYFAYYAIVNDQCDSLPYMWIFS